MKAKIDERLINKYYTYVHNFFFFFFFFFDMSTQKGKNIRTNDLHWKSYMCSYSYIQDTYFIREGYNTLPSQMILLRMNILRLYIN